MRILVAILCLCACTVRAQPVPVVAPDVQEPFVPQILRQPNTDQASATEPSGQQQSPSSPFVWGPVVLSPHLLDRFYYANGLQASPGEKLNSYVDSIAPGTLLDLGSDWSVDYTPTWTFYSSRSFRDTVDQSIRLAGALAFQDDSLQFSQSYVSSHEALIETAMQTYQQIYSTTLDAVHHFNNSLSIESLFNQSIQFITPPPDSYNWSLTNWIHYRFSSGFDLAGGLELGYIAVDPGTNMDYVQPQLRVSYLALERRLTFDIHFGDEEREFLSAHPTYLNSPTLGALIAYKPFVGTSVTLNAGRQVSTSFFVDQITEDTDWSVQLEQRLLRHFTIATGAGYSKSRYVATTNTVLAGREDYAYSYDVRLSSTFLRRGTITGFYQYTQNWSNVQGYSFASSQIGCEVGFKY